MTTTRYAVDPVTRIEGHLRLEIEVDETGAVADAWSTGTMFRGIEKILAGRNPLEAWMLAQRACGVCTHVHAIASVRAVENALGVQIPTNARILRNVMCGVQTVHDHVVHFYHLHLPDWVDVTKTLTADPKKTAALAAATNVGWGNNSAARFTSVKSKLAAFVASGQLGPFTNGYWGHSAYTCTPEESLLFYSHYLEALEFQREIAKIHAYIGGKNPHPQTYAVGGMSTRFAAKASSGVNATNLVKMRSIAQATKRFVDQVLIPDTVLLAKRYKTPWFTLGQGLGNLLAYGDIPLADGGGISSYLFPAGRIHGKVLTALPLDTTKVAETVARSWYSYAAGDSTLLAPYAGETTPDYTGPVPPYDMIDPGPDAKYSWLKAPRYDGVAYEVGPLARVMVAYAAGKAPFKTGVDTFVSKVGLSGVDQMFSTMGRLAARAIETQVLAAQVDGWLAELQTAQKSNKVTVAVPVQLPPGSVQGYGTTEAPRGALGHWVVIENGVVKTYQMVVPTTWNGSPRDGAGNRGAWETALQGTPLADPTKPVELLRTVHSFDPCMGCSVHVLDPDGGELSLVTVV